MFANLLNTGDMSARHISHLCLLLVACLSRLAVVQAEMVDSGFANNTIRMGYLITRDRTMVAGAISVAIEKAQRDGLLPDYNFRFV